MRSTKHSSFILFAVCVPSGAFHILPLHVRTPRMWSSKIRQYPITFSLSLQFPNNDDNIESKGISSNTDITQEDTILEDLEDLARSRQALVDDPWYGKVPADFNDEYDPLVDIVAIFVIAGVVGFAVYSLVDSSKTTEADSNFFETLLDWKDLVAFTAGETVSSSILRGLLFLGELSIFRSVEAELSNHNKGKVTEESKGFISRIWSIADDGEDEEVDWEAISIDIGSWIIYALLKDDICGGKIGISNSGLESAVLGGFAAAGTRLTIDAVVDKSDIFPNSDKLRKESRSRDLQKWVEIYAKTAVSAAALFSVYDLVLHILEGGRQ